MKKYTTIIFDIDDTLVDDTKNRIYAFEKVLEKFNLDKDKYKSEDFIIFDNEYWVKAGKKEILYPYNMAKEERTIWIRSNRFKEFIENITFDKAKEINNYYLEMLTKKIVPIKNSTEIIEYLINNNYIIGIATDGPLTAANKKLKSVMNINKIEIIVGAEESGYMKPKKEFYDYLFKKYKYLNKEEILLIGDSLEKDIKGGNNYQIDTCWFNPRREKNKTNIKPTYEIIDLIEIKKILQ